MLKLYLDESPLTTGHAIRGVGVYTREIKSALEKRRDIKLVDNKQDALVIYYPYFDLFYNSLKINKGENVVVMIHDVIPLLYPRNYPPGLRGKYNFIKQKNELKKAIAILCDSETSKKDIVRYLDIPEKNIFPTHLAPNPKVLGVTDRKRLNFTKEKFNLPETFVLYVGDINYNKNVINLVKACVELNVCLVIAGKQATSKDFNRNHIENLDLKTLIEEYGSNSLVKRLGYVSDRELSDIFSLAKLYCQPSFYEGFGLPVLEAMSANCPVICAKTQALVEIAGEAVVYFDPYSIDDLKTKISLVLGDNQLLEKLRDKGKEHIKKYLWKNTTDKTIQAIRKSL